MPDPRGTGRPITSGNSSWLRSDWTHEEARLRVVNTPVRLTDYSVTEPRNVNYPRYTYFCRASVRYTAMFENASQVVPEDSLERKRIQSQRDFEPLLDTDEAAKLLRMHPRTLRTKARRGSIPAVQVGKRWRFRASTLDLWLAKLAG